MEFKDVDIVHVNKIMGDVKFMCLAKGRLSYPEEHANKDKTGLYGTFRLQVPRQYIEDVEYGQSYDSIYCVLSGDVYSTIDQQEFMAMKDWEVLVEFSLRCVCRKSKEGDGYFNNASFYVSKISKLREIKNTRTGK